MTKTIDELERLVRDAMTAGPCGPENVADRLRALRELVAEIPALVARVRLQTPAAINAALLALPTDEQRMEATEGMCRYCGYPDPRCQCWNDE